jgi:uncharacterized protein (DUF58 family)
MKIVMRLTDWLEQRWVNPAYVGWVLLGLAIFFFAAATNTLAGWLYVMSGVLLALLAIAAILPPRNLKGLVVQRLPIDPVSAGQPLSMALQVKNPQPQTKGLFQIIDPIPTTLGDPQKTAIRSLGAGQSQTWRYRLLTERRGLYDWPEITLRSAAPLGLFWCRRTLVAPASVVVYPQILPLHHCPIVDTLGDRAGQQWQYRPVVKLSTEGVTRSLRPYRWGDPTRLIHWRTSARYGELRVRELEKVTASQEVIIALNTADRWEGEDFEQAVIAAASLYTYANQQGFAAALWLPPNSLIQDRPGVLLALAAIQPLPSQAALSLPPAPVVWLTGQSEPSPALPLGSRQIIWDRSRSHGSEPDGGTLWIDPEEPMQAQLQGHPMP